MLYMVAYSKAAVERAMKVQEVILRAIAKRITWWQAAEIIGVSDRQMVQPGRKRGVHRQRRERRPLPGMGCLSRAAITAGSRTSAGMS